MQRLRDDPRLGRSERSPMSEFTTPTIEQLQEQLVRDVTLAAERAYFKLKHVERHAAEARERMANGKTPTYTMSADAIGQPYSDSVEANAKLTQVLDYARHFLSAEAIEAAYALGVWSADPFRKVAQ